MKIDVFEKSFKNGLFWKCIVFRIFCFKCDRWKWRLLKRVMKNDGKMDYFIIDFISVFGCFVWLIGENVLKERCVYFKKIESIKFYLFKKFYFLFLFFGKKDYYIL